MRKRLLSPFVLAINHCRNVKVDNSFWLNKSILCRSTNLLSHPKYKYWKPYNQSSWGAALHIFLNHMLAFDKLDAYKTKQNWALGWRWLSYLLGQFIATYEERITVTIYNYHFAACMCACNIFFFSLRLIRSLTWVHIVTSRKVFVSGLNRTTLKSNDV